MRVEERTETVIKTVYISSDNTEFNSEKECHIHELKQEHKRAGNMVYIVKHKYMAIGSIEIFSTKELAERSLMNVEDTSRWIIEEKIIDWRFLV